MRKNGLVIVDMLFLFIYRRPTLYPLEIAVDFLKSLYTVTKSDRFLECRRKFTSPSRKKFLLENGNFFLFPKKNFICHQKGKLLRSGEWVFFHA